MAIQQYNIGDVGWIPADAATMAAPMQKLCLK